MTRNDLTYSVVPKDSSHRAERAIIYFAISIPLACLYLTALIGAAQLACLFH